MKERIVVEKNKKFGRLTVLDRANEYTKYGYAIWNCKCDCGNIVKVSSKNLREGHTKSCGCLKRETVIRTHTKHNLSRNRINKIYLAMKNRCYCKTSDRYSYYGGRGIKICDEWLSDFMSFYNWAMANGYNDKLTIDRINVNGNYEPSNCRWITKGEQTRNTRRNRIYKGKCFSEWAREIGISSETFLERVEKFGVEKATTLVKNYHIKSNHL